MTDDQRPARVTAASATARRDPADLAPSVDRDWATEFVHELRLLDVPGSRIGDALVTVEAHVRDSGERVGEAFGDAIAYAREIARDEPARAGGISAKSIVAAVLGLLGLLMLPAALGAWLDGTAASVTVGQVAAAAFTLAALLAFAAAADRAVRVLMRRAWVAVPAVLVMVLGNVLLIAALPAVVAQVPPLLQGGVGLLLVAISTALTWTDLSADDSVLAPGEQAPRRRIGRLAGSLVMPAFAVLILGFTWLMHLLV